MDVGDLLRIIGPVFLGAVAWYVWSMKQSFVSQFDFKRYKDNQNLKAQDLESRLYKKYDELSERINKQNTDIVEIKTDVKHIAEAMIDIKNHLFERKKKTK